MLTFSYVSTAIVGKSAKVITETFGTAHNEWRGNIYIYIYILTNFQDTVSLLLAKQDVRFFFFNTQIRIPRIQNYETAR